MSESNAFLATLQRHRAGGLLGEASDRLAEVVAAVKATGKAGNLTIRLDIKPAQRGQAAVVVTDKVTTKVPKVEAEASFWFATDSGDLTVNDPRQRELELRTVPGGKSEAPQEVRAAVGQ